MTRATIAISACLLLTVAALAEPRRQSTSRGRLKAVPTATISTSETTVAPDTLHSEIQSIEIAGYDKPATASKETFFVINGTDSTITELTVTFTYTDMQGRQLHQATHTIACSIPPRGTRMLSVPSWDRQRSFHYRLSTPPRKQSTPYDVTHRIESALATPEI